MQTRTMAGWLARALAAWVVAGGGEPVPVAQGAERAAKAPKLPPAKRLEPIKRKGLANGTMAFLVEKTGREPTRYLATNLMVTQPVLVTLKADRPGDDIRLAVTKTQWSRPVREVSTGKRGRVQVAFRTQGEFGLAVSGDEAGKPYRMTVWIGDEVRRPMAPVVVPRSGFKPAVKP